MLRYAYIDIYIHIIHIHQIHICILSKCTNPCKSQPEAMSRS